MSNGALSDAALSLHQSALYCQNVTQFYGTRVPVTVCMSINSSTTLPVAVFTSLSVNSNKYRSLVQNFTLIGQHKLIYALH